MKFYLFGFVFLFRRFCGELCFIFFIFLKGSCCILIFKKNCCFNGIDFGFIINILFILYIEIKFKWFSNYLVTILLYFIIGFEMLFS